MAPENIPSTPPVDNNDDGIVSEQKNKSEKRKIIITEVDIEKEAMDAAEAKMTATKEDLAGPRLFRGENRTSKEQLRGIGNISKKIWKHNLFHEYYRQKELSKSRRDIQNSGNLYVAEKGEKIDHNNAMKAIVDRFASEYEEEMIHTQAGEKKKVLTNDVSEEQTLKLNIQNMIGRYAIGEIDDEQFLKEKETIFQGNLKKIKSNEGENIIEKGEMYASNLLEIAKEVRQAVEHGKALDDLDLDFEVIIGKANVGVRTENNFSRVDKIIDKIQKSLPGKLLANEAIVASGVAITYGVLVKGSTSLANRLGKLLGPLGLGVSAGVGGVVAGAREGKRVQEERTQHSRDMAKGKSFEKNAQKRTEMEKYRHETKGANELASNLEKNLKALKENPNPDKKAFTAILAHLNEIEARVSFSDQKGVDLIQYSDAKKIEQERTRIDLVRAETKVYLKKIARSEIAGIDNTNLRFGKSEKDLQEYLEGIKDARVNDFLKEKTIKDDAFYKMRRKEMGKSFLKGMAVGAGVGIAVQEGIALFGGSSEGLLSTKEAFATNGVSEPHHFTALEYLRRYAIHDLPKIDTSQMHEEIFGNSHFKLPVGVDFHKNTNGSFDLLRNGKSIAKNLTLDQNGHLTNAARQILKDENIFTSDSTQQISSERTKEITHSPKEYIKNHENLFNKIKRGPWADNDTPKPDKNELKLWWGGEKGTGIDSNGKYVFNIKQMLPESSSHKGIHWNPQELIKEGKIKLLISLSGDSQNQVVEIPIDLSGNAIIDPNSEIGKIAFENVDGHVNFLGRFAEVAVSSGQKDGVDLFNSLATYEGKGLGDIKEIIKIPGENISSTIFEVPPENNEVDWPYAIPVLGRSPLEPTQREKQADITYGYGGENYGLLPREDYERRMSKKIIENKDLDVSNNDLDLIDEYLNKQDKNYLKELEEINSHNVPMKKEIKVSITVPAYQEEKNIKKTLENYAKLKNRDEFELVILENHPKNKTRDNTAEIIADIQKKYPDLNLVHLYKSFDEKPPIGIVRKYLVDSVLLRKSQAKIKESVVIASNDADLESISKDYAIDIAKAFENNKDLDAVGAKWDYPKEAFKKLPLLHASQRLWHFFDIAFRKYHLKSPELIGRNSAFRSGIYAAIGGYNETSQLAEDLEIGWLIKAARNYDAKRIDYLNKAWLKSNPRRAVVKLLSGGRLVEQYGDFHINEEIRSASMEDILKNKRDLNFDDFKKEVQANYDFQSKLKKSKGGWVEDIYVEKSFKRAMGFLGVKYQVKNDKIIITDISKLTKGLDNYTKK